MSDSGNVESHTIRLLQEMRADAALFRQEMGEFRQEMTEFKHEMTGFKQDRQDTERRLNVLEPAVIDLLGR